jgi:hypothetical protein
MRGGVYATRHILILRGGPNDRVSKDGKEKLR